MKRAKYENAVGLVALILKHATSFFHRAKNVDLQIWKDKTTGSPSSLGAVNMTLRNSVIIRVCMGIQRSYKIFQTKGKKIIKSTYLSCCLYNLWFYVVWRGFRAISVGFSFSVFFSL